MKVIRMLNADREAKGRPTDISSMSVRQTREEKGAIKHLLREYDQQFVKKYGRQVRIFVFMKICLIHLLHL